MNDTIIDEAAENYCLSTYVRPTDEKGLKPYEDNKMPGYNSYAKRAKKHFIAGVQWYKNQQFPDDTQRLPLNASFWQKLKWLFSK